MRNQSLAVIGLLCIVSTAYAQENPRPSENDSPDVSFATPTNGSQIAEGSQVFVVVNASDSDGSIDNVRLSLNGTFIRQENVDSYEWDDAALQGLPVGSHTLSAVTTDNEGATSTATISIEVVGDDDPEPPEIPPVTPPGGNDSPVISFATPANGSQIVGGSAVSVVVNASDSDGSIDNVQLSLDGTFVRQENRDPYEWDDAALQGLPAGTHELTAVTTDNEGATATATISLLIEPAPEPAPEPTPEPTPTPGNGELLSHDFNNGELSPFYPCTVQSPNYASVINGRVKTYWTEDGYRNTRSSRGAEFCDAQRGVDRALEMRTQKEGWMGFTMNIQSDHSRTSDSALAQVFGFNLARDQFTWTGLLTLIRGDLGVVHRAGGGSSNTTVTIIEDFEYGRDHDIIIGFAVSNQNRGKFEIWVDGSSVYSATNINLGLGDFNSQDEQTDQSHTTFKLGMYNHNDSDYVDGEERVVYYDNVSWYTGTNGFSIVDPSN